MAKKSIGKARDYKVGFGKPPVATQFKPGQSGNLKGRPRGSLNLSTVLDRAMRERVTVIERGKPKTITKLEAAAKQLANKAASGDFRALQMLLPQLHALDNTLSLAKPEAVDMDDQAVMAVLMQRFSASPTVQATQEATTHASAEPRHKRKKGAGP